MGWHWATGFWRAGAFSRSLTLQSGNMLILLHYTAKIARFSHSHLGNVGLKLVGVNWMLDSKITSNLWYAIKNQKEVSMSQCTACKMEIARDATICPHCRTSWGGQEIGIVNPQQAVSLLVWALTTKAGRITTAIFVAGMYLVVQYESLWGTLLAVSSGVVAGILRARSAAP